MNRKPATGPGMDPMIHNDQRSLQFHSPSPAALLDNALLKCQSLLLNLELIDSGGQQSRSTNVPRRYPNGSFHKELPRPRRTELCVLDMTRKHGQRVAL